ncbi:TIGR02099 family protein [Photobacterium japonica]|uniref:YhdP family protein n=1 Tax=Photobacterium japonica TaxID=2910235 RepID=UPI003D1018C0
MTTVPVRLVRGLMWLVLTVLVLAAIAISGLRFILPQLNDYREPIRQWASEQAGLRLDIAHVEGHWRNLGPSLVLQDVSVTMPDQPDSLVQVGDVSFQLDVLTSLWRLQPVFQDLRIDRLRLDVTGFQSAPDTASANEDDEQLATLKRLEEVLFVQLGQFSLRNSAITFMSPADERLTVEIQALKWDTLHDQRRAEGVISIADTHFSQVEVMANLSAKQSWSEQSGQIYLNARNLSLTPWLNKQRVSEAEITSSNINAQAWLTVADGQLQRSRLVLDDTFLRWTGKDGDHRFRVREGQLSLQPVLENGVPAGWRIDSDKLALQTDQADWPALDVAVQWSSAGWHVALNTLSLSHLRPLTELLPLDASVTEAIPQLQPRGQIHDLRLASDAQGVPRFSFEVEQLGLTHWEYVPGFNKLNAHVAGDAAGGRAHITLQKDSMPYGDMFQAALPIRNADVTAYWQMDAQGWRLWSDKLAVSTPDLSVDGQFRLDFPTDSPAWLSFYGEASIRHAGETWRYLPTQALGHELTDYLSAAIRGGQTKNAPLLWYGELNAFPYAQHDGVLQVFVPLRNGAFSFDTAWPELTDLNLDLRFENDWMYLDARHAKTLGATASRVTGGAELAENGHLKLTVDVAADGEQVRDYMLATPLVDSVGAALTTVQVSGPVTSQFKLDIPFDGSDVRAWGKATLNNNHVALNAPPIPLENVSGVVHFDNDKIKADNFTGTTLNQPVSLGFTGQSVVTKRVTTKNSESGYRVDVNLHGDWDMAALQKTLDDPLLAHVSGRSAWQGHVGVDLHDTGFTYQVKADAPLTHIRSQLPYPLTVTTPTTQQALRLAVTGNANTLTSTLTAPDATYQAQFNLIPEKLVIESSELTVGNAKRHALQRGVHGVDIDGVQVDADRWISLVGEIQDKMAATSHRDTASAMPDIPLPNRVQAKVKQLTLAGLDWHKVALSLSQRMTQDNAWQMNINSRELIGHALWPEGQPLRVELDSLHLNLPETETPKPKGRYQPQRDVPPVTDFDRSMMANVPDVDLLLHDAWLQGYRLGKVSGELRREDNMLALSNFTVNSGATILNLDGNWTLNGDHSETQLAFDVEGKNSSDIMGRFGISGGIQGAEFSTYASIQWQGAPWSMHRETLTGEMKSETGQGVISDIGGAGRLLGLFSIDSIVRKMQLDFSGIFDDGLAFNYIRGSGRIENGQFETSDIKMQALAGDMFIHGSANLVNETVDARVKFIPDFTSGIPVLTAFAVAPQVAIYVFAISTVLSPVVDVFTQINYSVQGPIDAPTVTEQSRFTGEYQVPESLTGKDAPESKDKP